jgi:two-component system NtrC family sensor kinase
MLSVLLAPNKRKIILTILLYLVLPSFFVAILVFSYVFKAVSDEVRVHFATEQKLLISKYETEIDAYLKGIVQSLRFASASYPTAGESFDEIFKNLNQAYGGVFMSMSLYDEAGRKLENYGFFESNDQDMLDALPVSVDARDGTAISDVFSGKNSGPYFFIEVKHDHDGLAFVMRAKVNALAFSAMIDNVRFGRTGEIFVVNGNGVLQTRSLSGGPILGKIDELGKIDLESTDADHIFERNGVDYYFRTARIESNPSWLLVVQREAGEQRQILLSQTYKLGMLFFFCLVVLLLAAHTAIVRLLRHYEALDACQVQLQNQSLQSQKRMAVEQLSVGIAHEINNPLAIIGEEAGWLQDLLKRESMISFPEHAEFKSSLQVIAAQIGRCREITHKLLSFARKLNYVVRDVDLRVLVSEVVGLRQAEIAEKNIVLQTNLADNLPIIHSEPILLRQALLTILDNAIDAVNREGIVSISVDKDKDGRIGIHVSDTGRGIPTENIDKIFDPFFTTKEPGKGTGLGLSICWGIVQKLGGDIKVASKPNEKTTFTVQLPLDPPKDNS